MQAGIGGYKTAAPATGSAPASGDLRKSSLWDDSARTSCAHTDADCADKVLAHPVDVVVKAYGLPAPRSATAYASAQCGMRRTSRSLV